MGWDTVDIFLYSAPAQFNPIICHNYIGVWTDRRKNFNSVKLVIIKK